MTYWLILFVFLSVMLGGVPDNACGVMGCTLRFLSQDIPRLYTLHPTLYARLRSAPHSTPKTHPKSVKNVVFTLFPCSVRFFFVSLHREPAPGMSVHRLRRVADILKRRLLALCSDALKSRKFLVQ